MSNFNNYALFTIRKDVAPKKTHGPQNLLPFPADQPNGQVRLLYSDSYFIYMCVIDPVDKCDLVINDSSNYATFVRNIDTVCNGKNTQSGSVVNVHLNGGYNLILSQNTMSFMWIHESFNLCIHIMLQRNTAE